MFARRKWMVGAVAGLIAAGGIAAGCGDEDESGGDGGKKPTNIAYISYSNTDYNQAEVKGMKKALAENGGGSVKVFNSNFDPQAFQKQCEDAVASGRYNAIVLNTLSPPGGVPCVKVAKAADIPVGTLEQTVGTDPKRTYDINPQVDGVEAVNTYVVDTQIETATELVKEACGDADPCKVVYEIGTNEDLFGKDTIKGVKKNLPQVDVVQTFTANYDPAGVAKAMPDILAANPDLNVYLAAADSSALAALPAIEDAGLTDKIKVIGNGGSATGVKAIADGSLFGSNGNWPQQSGEFVVNNLIKAVRGEKIETPGSDGLKQDTPVLLTKETVGDYKAEW